jgi:hypothetical protein
MFWKWPITPTSQQPPAPLQPAFSPSTGPHSPAPSQPTFSPVSFAEVVRVSKDATLTELQKDEFRRKHGNRLVEWIVLVRGVQQQADSEFIVGFHPPEHRENDGLAFDEFGAATFPSNSRDDMIDLHAGDIIRFRGTLEFLGIGKTPLLRNCQLLERHKP